MSRTADVVVVGGGVSGTSIAWHLAVRGVRVILVERGAVGDGISGTSGAIVRQHYSVPALATMARYSLETFRDFEARVGGPAGFVETGYLVLVGPGDRATLEVNVAALRGQGIDIRLLDRGQIETVLPHADLDEIDAASWEPQAGYADGRLTAETFASQAVRHGAELLAGTEVTALRVAGDRVVGVETSAGPIDAGTVVVAASVGAPRLLHPLGLDFPISFEREWICFFRRPWAMRDRHPAGVDLQLRGHFRPEGDRATLFGGEAPPEAIRVADPAVFERRATDGDLATARAALARRFPAMATAVALGGYGCVDDITPDWQPYLGPVRGVDGLVAAYGMSSHFFKHAPAVGRVVSDAIIDGRSELVDIAMFRPERFADGQPIRSPHPYPTATTL